jgi:hypothetical protein
MAGFALPVYSDRTDESIYWFFTRQGYPNWLTINGQQSIL